jgi:hypothetical protein
MRGSWLRRYELNFLQAMQTTLAPTVVKEMQRSDLSSLSFVVLIVCIRNREIESRDRICNN